MAYVPVGSDYGPTTIREHIVIERLERQSDGSVDIALVRRQGGWKCIESKGGEQLLDRLLVKEHAIASSISPMVMMDLGATLSVTTIAMFRTDDCDPFGETRSRTFHGERSILIEHPITSP